MPANNWSVEIPGVRNSRTYLGNNQVAYAAVSARASETRSGVSRRKPSGFIPPTGYVLNHVTKRYQTGSMLILPAWPPNANTGTYTWGVVGSPTSGYFNGDSHFDSALSEAKAKSYSDIESAALVAARLRLKSSDVNLGVAFAERNQTARLLGDTATRLAKSFTALKRGQWRKALDYLGIASKKGKPRGSNVTNQWLELQYGWKPFVSDVYGAAAALSKRPQGDWRVTAKATRSVDLSNTFRKVATSPTNNFDQHECRVKGFRSVFVRIDALPSNAALMALASLGFSNPALILWEKIPFSFVVDWSFQVGDWLDSLDATLGYDSLTTSISRFSKAEWVDVGLRRSFGNPKIWNDFQGSKRLVYLERSATAGVPQAPMPRLKDPRSLGHMANGLALLSQAFAPHR